MSTRSPALGTTPYSSVPLRPRQEFFGALIDGPVLPCATAVTALSCGAIAPPLLSGRARITIAPAPREGAVRSADGSG
eukprot:394613-Prymnesium_polylepis.1